MNSIKRYKLYILGILILVLACYFIYLHYHHKPASFKCPEQYGENEFSVYLAEAEKWMSETRANNPGITDDKLWELRTQLLIDNGCKGRNP